MAQTINQTDSKYLIEELGIEVGSTLGMDLDITGNQEVPLVSICYPKSTEEVASIAKFCNDNEIPLVTVGGATNLNGGTVPNAKGIAVSLKRMNQIFYVDRFSRTAEVQSGCNTQEFINRVEKEDLLFPQNIASADRSTIGGNLAISSGSPRSLFYGTTKNYVLNLEVVLPDGQIINTGYNVTKLATGLNLTQLMIGSEGTLGIITKATFRLLVPKKYRMVSQFTFDSESKLFDTFRAIFTSGFDPVSVEFMDSQGVSFVKSHLKDSGRISQSKGGILWMEWESNSEAELKTLELEIENTFSNMVTEIFLAKSKASISEIWKYRQCIGYAVKEISSFTDIDVVVPRSKVKELYECVKFICRKEQVRFTSFAHIGDGNLHINILRDHCDDEQWLKKTDVIFKYTYQKATALGGAISGEHGVGMAQQKHLKEFFPAVNMKLNKKIQKSFDPKGILNPGVLFKRKS